MPDPSGGSALAQNHPSGFCIVGVVPIYALPIFLGLFHCHAFPTLCQVSLEHYGLLLTEMGRVNEAQRAQTLAASIRARVAEVNRVKFEEGAPRSKPAVKKIVTQG